MVQVYNEDELRRALDSHQEKIHIMDDFSISASLPVTGAITIESGSTKAAPAADSRKTLSKNPGFTDAMFYIQNGVLTLRKLILLSTLTQPSTCSGNLESATPDCGNPSDPLIIAEKGCLVLETGFEIQSAPQQKKEQLSPLLLPAPERLSKQIQQQGLLQVRQEAEHEQKARRQKTETTDATAIDTHGPTIAKGISEIEKAGQVAAAKISKTGEDKTAAKDQNVAEIKTVTERPHTNADTAPVLFPLQWSLSRREDAPGFTAQLPQESVNRHSKNAKTRLSAIRDTEDLSESAPANAETAFSAPAAVSLSIESPSQTAESGANASLGETAWIYSARPIPGRFTEKRAMSPAPRTKNTGAAAASAVTSSLSVKLTFCRGRVSGFPAVRGIPGAIVSPSGSSVRIPDQIPSRRGFSFCGWALHPLADSADYQPGSTLAVATNTQGEIKLYALWQPAQKK